MKGSYGTILLFAVLSLLGIIVGPKIKVLVDSKSGNNIILVAFRWANAAPEALERQVTAPLEGILGTIPGVSKIESTSGYHSGNIILTLDDASQMDQMRFEISSVIRQVYRSLPAGVSYPIIELNHVADKGPEEPLISIQLNGNASAEILRRYIETVIRPRLSSINGVKSINVYGGETRETIVSYDPEHLRVLGLSEIVIGSSLATIYQQKGIGWVRNESGHEERLFVQPPINDVAIGDQIIISRGERVVRLSDVAKVSRKQIPASSIFRINGKNAIQIVLTSDENASQMAVADQIKHTLDIIKTNLPSNYQLTVDYDASILIERNLRQTVFQSGIASILLIILTVFFIRDYRKIVIVVIGLFATISLSALVFFTLDLSVRFFSVSAYVVSMGFALWNLFLALEHFFTISNRTIVPVLLSNSFLIFIALSLVRMLPESMRMEITDFSTAFIICQISSLCISIWLIPALSFKLCAKYPSVKREKSRASILESVYFVVVRYIVQFKVAVILLFILLFGIPVYMLPTQIDSKSPFSNVYNSTVGSDWYQENIQSYVQILGGSLRLFNQYVYSRLSLQSRDQTVLHITASLPNHSTLVQMDQVLRSVEKKLESYQGVDRFITQIYSGQQGRVAIYFNSDCQDCSAVYKLKSQMIRLSTQMSGIDWNIFGVGQGYSMNSDAEGTPTFNVELQGYNYKELENITSELKNILIRHPRVQNVDLNRVPGIFKPKDLYTYVMKTDKAYWAGHDVSMQDLFTRINDRSARPAVDQYIFLKDIYEPVKIVPELKSSYDINALESIPLQISDSLTSKIGGFSEISREKTISSIRKQDQQYLRQISFDYLGSINFGEKYLDRTLYVFNKNLPMGYHANKQPSFWWKLEEKYQYMFLLVLLLSLFAIGSIFLESITQSLSIIFLVPLSAIGSFLAFYWTGSGFDQGGYMSFLLISFIITPLLLLVINEFNSLKVDYWQTEKRRFSLAVRKSIRSILFLFLAVQSTLISFILAGESNPFWYTMSVGTTGGAFFSLILIFVLLPALLLTRER